MRFISYPLVTICFWASNWSRVQRVSLSMTSFYYWRVKANSKAVRSWFRQGCSARIFLFRSPSTCFGLQRSGSDCSQWCCSSSGGSLRKLDSPFLLHKPSTEPGEPVPCGKSVVSPCLCHVDGQDSAPWALQGAGGGVQPAQILLFKQLADVPWGSTMLDQVSPWCPGAVADPGTLFPPLRWQGGLVQSFWIICPSGSYPAAHTVWMVLCWGNLKISKQDRKKAKPTHV